MSIQSKSSLYRYKLSENMSLAQIYGRDLFCAFISASLVVPFIKIIDRSIFENASGKRDLKVCLKEGFSELFTTPWKLFMRPGIRYIKAVYFPTYAAANTTVSYCQLHDINPEIPKFLIVSATNIFTSIYKDTQFTKMFSNKPPTQLPTASLMLFGLRDSITIAASFNAPKYFSQFLVNKFSFDKKNADIFSQITLPMVFQMLCVPPYLLALDLYNNPNNNFSQKIASIKLNFWKTFFARIARIGPAYGIGGVVNKYLMDKYRNPYFLNY